MLHAMTEVENPFMPEEGFRFSAPQLDHYFNGRVHVLRPGQDYPNQMPVEVIKKRLKRAAWVREGTARVWVVDGRVHVCLTRWR